MPIYNHMFSERTRDIFLAILICLIPALACDTLVDGEDDSGSECEETPCTATFTAKRDNTLIADSRDPRTLDTVYRGDALAVGCFWVVDDSGNLDSSFQCYGAFIDFLISDELENREIEKATLTLTVHDQPDNY